MAGDQLLSVVFGKCWNIHLITRKASSYEGARNKSCNCLCLPFEKYTVTGLISELKPKPYL